jgi:cAMP-dependent protein kinase regulator
VAGTNIVKQNQNGQYLQIIQKGKVDLYCEIQSKTCGTLQEGDIFGEVALLYGEIADVSYNASKKRPAVVLWRIDHAVFRHILASSAHQRDSNIVACLQKVPMFQSMGEQQLQKFADSMTRVTFHKGERIVTKGNEGTVFYLVEDGSVKVHDIGIGDSKAVDQFLQVGGKLDFEAALIPPFDRCSRTLSPTYSGRLLWRTITADRRTSCRTCNCRIGYWHITGHGSR